MFLIILSIAVIAINSIWCMTILSKAQWYWYIFQDYPPDMIRLRYLTSWFGRLLLLVAALGMCRLKNWARKFAVLLLFINILTIPWKHPQKAFAHSLEYTKHSQLFYVLQQETPFRNIELSALASIVLNIWDLLLYAALIFILTRKSVKEKFV